MSKNERPRVVLVNRCIISNDKNQILLIKRSEEQITNVGFWEVPGGKLDIGQDLSHSLEREVLEETGLLVEPLSRLVFADSFVLHDGKYKGLAYIALFGTAKLIGGKIQLSVEHDDFAWIAPKKALDYELTQETRKALIILG